MTIDYCNITAEGAEIAEKRSFVIIKKKIISLIGAEGKQKTANRRQYAVGRRKSNS
jgi:hypothetical protein